MAEYIDRAELFKQGEWMYDPKAKCEADASRYVVKMDTIQLMQPADVVEREKLKQTLDEAHRIRITVLGNNGRYESDEVLDLIEEIIQLFEEI